MKRILSILCFIALFQLQSFAQMGEEGEANICLGPEYDQTHNESAANGHWVITEHCNDKSNCITGEDLGPVCHEFSSEFISDPPPDEDPNGDPGGNPGGGTGGGGGGGGGGGTPTNNCPVPSVSISGPPAIVLPGELITLTANVTFPSGANPSNYTDLVYDFQARVGGAWVYLADPSNGQSNTLSYTVKVLGTIYYRVIFRYKCVGTTNSNQMLSNEINSRSQFCNQDITAKFSSEMDNAWNSTLTATANGNGKYEYGFLAKFNRGNFETEDFSNTADCSTPENTSSNTYTVPNGADPNVGAIWYIGKFHTHPPLTNCNSNVTRTPGPSSIDLGNSTDFPCIVRDYTTQVAGGHNASLPTTDYTYNTTCTVY